MEKNHWPITYGPDEKFVYQLGARVGMAPLHMRISLESNRGFTFVTKPSMMLMRVNTLLMFWRREV